MQLVPYVIMFGGIALLAVTPRLYRLYRDSVDIAHEEDKEELVEFFIKRAGGSPPRLTATSWLLMPAIPSLMIVVISLAVLGAALYVLVVRRDDPLWATSAVSTILGYWLRAGTHS